MERAKAKVGRAVARAARVGVLAAVAEAAAVIEKAVEVTGRVQAEKGAVAWAKEREVAQQGRDHLWPETSAHATRMAFISTFKWCCPSSSTGVLLSARGEVAQSPFSIVRSRTTRMTPSVRKLGIVGLDPVSLHVVHAVSDWL